MIMFHDGWESHSSGASVTESRCQGLVKLPHTDKRLLVPGQETLIPRVRRETEIRPEPGLSRAVCEPVKF